MKLRHILPVVVALPLAACANLSMERGGDRFQAGLGDAVAAPLEDLNLRQAEVPEVLIEARHRPYSLAGMRTCAAIGAEVGRLNEALGPDLDAPASDDGPARDEQAADAALGVVRDTATDFIPFRSWVRRLSGAHAYSEAVEQAYQAGVTRRAFLKGVGQNRRCAHPAAPRAGATAP